MTHPQEEKGDEDDYMYAFRDYAELYDDPYEMGLKMNSISKHSRFQRKKRLSKAPHAKLERQRRRVGKK
jgi:hypothetical protein